LIPNCELNAAGKEIKIVNKACSDYDGKTIFNVVNTGNVGASSLLKTTDFGRAAEWKQEEIEVECIRLDTFMKNNDMESVDMLWVDVQGAEKKVFDGLGDKLLKTKVINTEVGLKDLYHGSILAEELNDYMINKGFVNLSSLYMISDFELNDEIEIVYINKNLIK
jgi:FkbM family methyltransferase